MIEFVNVHKTLGDRKVLDGLTFRVERGETFVIIGRSGCGKSVTFKHLVGLLKPDAGSIRVEGQETTRFRPREMLELRHRFGMLFQSAALLNWLTVEENVALPLREHTRLPPSEILLRAHAKLDLVDLRDAARKMPSELSGGMKKRAGLARALVREPQIVLYDEPTAGLDPVMSARINRLVRDMQGRLGLTSIMVTHDMESAYAVADRIGMLYNGRLIEVGTPDQVRKTQNPIVRQFITGSLEGPLGD
ncbi:MAG: ABC transporter ATP-binding protein [Planctomycetes bacterium]|nr:ABC transporter ATP-binding protein [Planctomycetota bacterium]